MIARLAAATLLTVTAVACGSGDAEPAPTTDTAATLDRTDTPSVEGQPVEPVSPASLDFLGAIVVPSSTQVVELGASGGAFDLADGTSVIVPAGSLSDPTDITATVVEIDVDQFVPGVVDGVGYVLSTDDAVDLATPISIEVAAAGVVHQLRDGEWIELDRSEVTIEHFSEVPTVVLDGDPGAVGDVPTEPRSEGAADAEFLFVCINFLAATKFHDGAGAGGIGIELAYLACTQALIDRYRPSDVAVSIGCVGDRIGEVDLRAAIDACIADSTEVDPGPDDDPTPEPDPDGAVESTTTTSTSVAPTEEAGPIALEGAFDIEPGSLEEILTNEVLLTIDPDGTISGLGTIVSESVGYVEATDCAYDYEWQLDVTIEGALTDEVGPTGGAVAALDLRSEQRYNRNLNADDEDCPVRIVAPTAATTAEAEVRFTTPASITATIEPVRPSPFVRIPAFDAIELDAE